jgi:hypothetical protein
MAAENLVKGALPRVQWGPVIAGALCAIAAHIVLGLFGTAFGLSAAPADSEGIGLGAGIYGLLVPFVASLLGAWICVRLAREADAGGAAIHGVLPWAIGLIAGALFLTSTLATSAMSAATATSGNVRGQTADSARQGAQSGRAEARADEAAEGAAAAAGAGGLGALLGLGGALAGAALGRRSLTGERFGRRHATERTDERYYREETGVAHAERGGIVTSSTPRTPEVARTREMPGEDPTIHH